MLPNCIRCLIHASRRRLGVVLARCRLHDIRIVDQGGKPAVMKRRRTGSAIAIYFGNLYLRLQRSDVEVLKNDEWLQWELAVQNAMKSDGSCPITENAERNSHTLIRRYMPGCSLREILNDVGYSEDQKLAAIELGLKSLDELHRYQVDWGNEIFQPLSHGDATVNNVIVDLDRNAASWIDFDTRHLFHLPEADRQVDDLRAIIFSAAVFLPVSCYRRLAELTMASLDDRVLRDRFCKRLKSDWRQLNTFHLAQAPLSWKSIEAIRKAILSQYRGGD
jgi:hypothetical protein